MKAGAQKNSIRFWPRDDRPREKLLRCGEHRLSDSELLAILLRTGSRGESAVDLARRVLAAFETFRGMSHTDMRDWKAFRGIGPAKLAQIKAALEIARRFHESRIEEDRLPVKSSGAIADMFMPRLRDLKKEVFKVVFLNSRNRIIAVEELAEGTVNSAAPIIREIFHRALQHFAVAMICVHNHPAGDVQPSPQDRDFTRQLVRAGLTLQVKVLDHIIIGNGVYYSFADAGQMGE